MIHFAVVAQQSSVSANKARVRGEGGDWVGTPQLLKSSVLN